MQNPVRGLKVTHLALAGFGIAIVAVVLPWFWVAAFNDAIAFQCTWWMIIPVWALFVPHTLRELYKDTTIVASDGTVHVLWLIAAGILGPILYIFGKVASFVGKLRL